MSDSRDESYGSGKIIVLMNTALEQLGFVIDSL